MIWIQCFRAVVVGIFFLLPTSWQPAAAQSQADHVILITSNGWHTGITIARSDLLGGAIPEIADFRDAVYFEFGWGDAEYYPASHPTFDMALNAALPGPAVVHVMGLPGHPAELFPAAEWVAVPLSDEGLQRLIGYLNASFDRAGAVRARPNAPGLYWFSLFYPATGEFHLFNTCNTWTARALATAGLPVQLVGTQRAENVMTQVRPLALRK
jgi:uncharacterized protein (TIGR02117 family)